MEGDPTAALWHFGTLGPGNSIGEDVLANTVLDTVSDDVVKSLACEERERRLQCAWTLGKIVERRTTNCGQNCFGVGGAYGRRKGPRRENNEVVAYLSRLDHHQGVLSAKDSGGNI